MVLVDSHCHLDMLDPASTHRNLDQIVEDARAQGVEHILNVCVSLKEFPKVLATAKKYPFVSASLGLHPNEQEEETSAEELIRLAQDEKVVAIGETGLDYYRSTGDLSWQKQRFREHIRAALATECPLIIHTRQAKDETLELLKDEKAAEVGGVLHCFTEDWEMASQALDLGFYISFSGIVTFRSALTLQDVAKRVPLDRMLLETDSPYLAPSPHRGKPNEPAFMTHTAHFISELRGMDAEELAETTTKNFFRLFKRAKHV